MSRINYDMSTVYESKSIRDILFNFCIEIQRLLKVAGSANILETTVDEDRHIVATPTNRS